MFWFVPLLAHVPTYTGGVQNCFTPPHHHTTSQVIYLKGSGGLELHIASPTDPFDIYGGELIDIDAVFKEPYDQSTYSLYIGCGGCVPSEDPIVVPPTSLNGYQHGEVEPFTQTTYYSVFPKADRKFNASVLNGCTEHHFTIRLVDHNNRTNGDELVWGAVIGLGERFTVEELLSFPLFIQRNHGTTWNNLGWTFPLSFLLGALLALLCSFFIEFGPSPIQWSVQEWSVREWLYTISIFGFIGMMIEEFVHLMYAQSGVPIGYGLGVGLVGVIFIANGIPLLQVMLAKSYASGRKEGRNEAMKGGVYETATWLLKAAFEIGIGVAYLFLLGAGFYIGPSGIILAGIVRILELVYKPANESVIDCMSTCLGTATGAGSTGSRPPAVGVVYDLIPGVNLKMDRAIVGV